MQQQLGSHPNIVQFYDAAFLSGRDQSSRTVLILMELCPGERPLSPGTEERGAHDGLTRFALPRTCPYRSR